MCLLYTQGRILGGSDSSRRSKVTDGKAVASIPISKASSGVVVLATSPVTGTRHRSGQVWWYRHSDVQLSLGKIWVLLLKQSYVICPKPHLSLERDSFAGLIHALQFVQGTAAFSNSSEAWKGLFGAGVDIILWQVSCLLASFSTIYSGPSLSGHSQHSPPSLMWSGLFATSIMNAFTSPRQRPPL